MKNQKRLSQRNYRFNKFNEFQIIFYPDINYRMSAYLDMMMTNHPLITDSSASDNENNYNFNSVVIKQGGGDPKNKNDILKKIPTGSFPPLFMITKEEQEKEEQNKARTFSAPSNKTALSIKEIMQERREDKKPFISL